MGVAVRGTVVGAGSTSSTVTSVLTIPATAQAGDRAYFAIVQGGGQTITINASSGNPWDNDPSLQAWNGTTGRLTVYSRDLTADDAGTTIGATFAAGQIYSIGLIVVSGADIFNITISTAKIKATASTTDTFNPVTPLRDDALIIYFDGSQLGSSSATVITHTVPTSYAELLDQSQTGTVNHTGLAIGTRSLTGNNGVAQTVGSITVGPSARQMALVIAVPPAVASSVTLTPAVVAVSAVALSVATAASSVTLTPAAVAVSAVALTATAGPVSVTLTPAAVALSARPLVATPSVTLSPAVLAVTARPLVTTPVVSLNPAVVTVSAVPPTVTAAGSVALSPATVTISAVPLGPAVGPRTIALSPAVYTLSAVPLGVAVGPRTVALTPAVLTVSAIAVVPVPQPVQVGLSPAGLVIAAVQLAPVAQGFIGLTPAVLSISAVPLSVRPTITLSPAVLAISAVSVSAKAISVVALAPAIVTVTARPLVLTPVVALTPAGLSVSAVPLVTVPGALSVPLTPATIAVLAVALEVVTGRGEPYTVTLDLGGLFVTLALPGRDRPGDLGQLTGSAALGSLRTTLEVAP